MKADGLHDPLPQFHRGDGRASRSVSREGIVAVWSINIKD